MEIKTAEEILTEELSESHILILNKTPILKDWVIDAMIEYSKQFIDLAAENIFNKSLLTEKHYNKQSILDIKQLIK